MQSHMNKIYYIHTVGIINLFLFCTKMHYETELCEAYQKILVFLYGSSLQPFCMDTSPQETID